MSAHVYLFLDASGTPVYIGSTRNLKRRVREHRTSPWIGDADRWVAFAYPTIDAALADEARLIALAQPRHNRHSRNAGPSFLTLMFGLISGTMPNDDDLRLAGLLSKAKVAA